MSPPEKWAPRICSRRRNIREAEREVNCMAKRFLICALTFAASAGIAMHGAAQQQSQQQAAPAAPAAKPDAQTPALQDVPTTIRSTTRMVQLSVVVTDKKGQPVTGLKKEDFKIFDESAPQ